MNKIQKNRLLKLADFVEKVKPGRFDFSHWVGIDWEGATDLSCGTTACALGWATTMPFFRRLGVRMEGYDVGLKGTGLFGVKVAVKIFGITESEANFLFTPANPFSRCYAGYDYETDKLGADATPKQWARFARKFVKNYED